MPLMRSRAAAGKTGREPHARLSADFSAGRGAAGLVPPPCGIDFADRGSDALTAQRQEAGPAQAGPAVPAPSPNRTGMPDRLKAGIEALSGIDMSDVKVHANSDRPAKVDAHAYAQGNDIHLAPGQEKHLPHEAWHVVQQRQGRVRPTMQAKGVAINDDPGLETEATRMGEKALRWGGPVSLESSAEEKVLPPAAAPVSRFAVVQRSNDEDQTSDENEANAVLDKARRQILDVGQDEEAKDDAMDLSVGFSEQAESHGGDVTTERRSIRLQLDQGDGHGVRTFYITPGQRAYLHQAAETEYWNYRYTYEGVEYYGQYLQYRPQQQLSQFVSANPIQRAATVVGAFNPAAAKAAYGGALNLVNGTITYIGVNGQNVTTGARGTSLNRQPSGTGVGKTRPSQWAQFLAMVGAANPFKQGHHMHQDLGGDGTHDNLAPFTSSLNGLHYSRVESEVLDHTNAPPGSDQYASYQTIPTYGGTASLRTWGRNQFNAMPGANQLAAMVGAGIMTPAVAAAAGGAPSGPQLTSGRNWITAYINATFPSLITCTARFIDRVGGVKTATPAQVVTITNDF